MFVEDNDAHGSQYEVTLDPLLAAAAVFVSTLGSYISLQIAGTAIVQRLAKRSRWRYVILAVASFFAASISIFCMHFIGMTAIVFHPGTERIYDLALTILSLAAVLLFGASSIFIALCFRLWHVEEDEKTRQISADNDRYAQDGSVRLVMRKESRRSQQQSVGSNSVVNFEGELVKVPSTSGSQRKYVLSATRSTRIVPESTSTAVMTEHPHPLSHRDLCASDATFDGVADVENARSVANISEEPRALVDHSSPTQQGDNSPPLGRFSALLLWCKNISITQLWGNYIHMHWLWLLLLIALLAIGAVLMHHLGMMSFRGHVCPQYVGVIAPLPMLLGAVVCVAGVIIFHICPQGLYSLLASLVVGTGVSAFHYASNAGMHFYDSQCPVLGSEKFPTIMANDLSVIIIAFSLLASVTMQVFLSYVLAREQDRIRPLIVQNQEQRKLAESLLSSVVPEAVAQELREGFRYSRDHHATVIFIDICNFTAMSAKKSPSELVDSLDTFYGRVDEAAAKFSVEPIKKIGDGGLYCCGAPLPLPKHEINAVLFALEVLQFVPSMKFCGSPFSVRVGIATGNIVSGVVGCRRFAYDIWGPTVNLASRMESTSMPGVLQMSESTLAAFRHPIHPLLNSFEKREGVAVKGFGIVSTYILDVSRCSAEVFREVGLYSRQTDRSGTALRTGVAETRISIPNALPDTCDGHNSS